MDINKDINPNQLIDIITNEVMRYIKSNQAYNSNDKKSVLVLGDLEKAIRKYSGKYDYHNIESYMLDGDIEKYCFVFITELSNAQLCDIALGRDSTPFTCAIQKSLLTGKLVYLCESGLFYRKYKETVALKLYDVFEKYVQKLVEYGIVLTEDLPIEKELNCKADGINKYDSNEKLITYSVAQTLCKNGKKQVLLHKGTIITPLAKDLFFETKTKINIK